MSRLVSISTYPGAKLKDRCLHRHNFAADKHRLCGHDADKGQRLCDAIQAVQFMSGSLFEQNRYWALCLVERLGKRLVEAEYLKPGYVITAG